MTEVFIWLDEVNTAYPILGVFPTLEAAEEEIAKSDHTAERPCCSLYKETLYPEGATIEPTFYDVCPAKPR